MNPPLHFFLDYTSPYTYLASTQVEALTARHGTPLLWRPASLGAVMKATENAPPASNAYKARYMLADLDRWASFYGVPFHFSPHFPIVNLVALRATVAVQERAPSEATAFIHRLFRAFWAEGLNLGDADLVGMLAMDCGIAPEVVEGANNDPAIKEVLKRNTQEAVAAGAFGFPALVLGEELYFGNDRLPLLETRLARGTPWLEKS